MKIVHKARLYDAGRYVAILKSREPVDGGALNFTQAQKLDSYLDSLRSKALILEYRADVELENHSGGMILGSHRKPMAHSRRDWYLVLANAGEGSARGVCFKFEEVDGVDGKVWDVLTDISDEKTAIEVLAPYGGEARFLINVAMGSAPQVRCMVS